MMAFRFRDEEESHEVVPLLFHTDRSRRAAKLFLDWFLKKHGRATKGEMNAFGHTLESGALGFEFSHSAFYSGVVEPLREYGLINLEAEWDRWSRKTVSVYKRVRQPIPKRRPWRPSIVYNAHIIAERWNAIFAD